MVFILSQPNSYALATNSSLPNMQDSTQVFLSQSKEKVIGNMMMRQIRAYQPFYADPILSDYLDRLLNILSRNAQNPSQFYNIFPLQDNTANAFAFFGGNIAVHTGLLQLAGQESELVAVLAHEMSHIELRHLARMMAHQKSMKPMMWLELLAAIGIGIFHPGVGQHLLLGAMGVNAQKMINFTRDHEKEADNHAIKILHGTGFHPNGLIDMFSRMQRDARLDSDVSEYLRTHPLFPSRITAIKHKISYFPYKQRQVGLDFQLIKMRDSIVKPKQQLRQLKRQLKKQQYQLLSVIEFGIGYCYEKQKKWKQARDHYLKAKDAAPDNIMINLHLAHSLFNTGNVKQSEKLFEYLLSWYPDNRSVILYYLPILKQTKQFNKAKKLLLGLQKRYPEELMVYWWLSKIYNELKQPGKMHIALAKWQILQGNFGKAEQQLNFAVQKAPDMKRESGRLKQQIKETLKEEKSIGSL